MIIGGKAAMASGKRQDPIRWVTNEMRDFAVARRILKTGKGAVDTFLGRGAEDQHDSR